MTKTGSFRFEPDVMAKMRELINKRGKLWFYKLIEREFAKLERSKNEL